MAPIRASIVVLTYNQLKNCTVPCLESILAHTPGGRYELIVVDNASTDGTPEFLRGFAQGRDQVRLVLNETNKGYAAGNNDGMRLACGNAVVLLNNDTLVCPGWLDGLLAPLEADPKVGLVGPVSNSVGNEQRAVYAGLKEKDYESFAAAYVARHGGVTFSPDRLGFFCVAIRREVVERIGMLDENFGLGMFEDDDYCLRATQAGFRLLVTEGAFVYHKGSVSFGALGEREYSETFARNKAYFMRKHGRAWTFSDMALSFWDKCETDVAGALERGGDPGPALERVAERLRIGRALLLMVRDKEAGHELERLRTPGAAAPGAARETREPAPAAPAAAASPSPLDPRTRWAVRREVFRNEFLNASWRRRRRYAGAVLRALPGGSALTGAAQGAARAWARLRRQDRMPAADLRGQAQAKIRTLEPERFMPCVEKYLRPGYRIADIGSGQGAYWWSMLPEGCRIDGFDPWFKPDPVPDFATIVETDGAALFRHPEYAGLYDYAVADHVFEHVADPEDLARSLVHCLKPGGYAHVGIPDATCFTDRFYRLVHKNGGGHIAQHTLESFTDLAARHGFSVVEVNPWPDDWMWLEKCYDLKYQQVEHLTQEELEFLARTLRTVLNPRDGHLYGWEIVLRKDRE